MSELEVDAGSGVVVLDPSDKRVVQFNWDRRSLATSATISTSTFTIGTIRQIGATALTKDNPSILSGSRKTQVRLDATTATDGDEYTLINTIVTNETPAQTKEQSVRVKIQNR